ncbi:UNVERIFIED_CONTAM: hypothetical protein RMT77_019581 [Armadillidium vulgare]
MKLLLFCFIGFVFSVVGIFSLKCVTPCDKSICTEPVGCKWGIGLEPCKCCNRCLKGEGETCGGYWNLDGVCGKDLTCEPFVPDEDYDEVYKPRGKCVPS